MLSMHPNTLKMIGGQNSMTSIECYSKCIPFCSQCQFHQPFFVMHIMLLRCTFHNSVPLIIVVIMGMFFLPHHNVCLSQLFILSTLSCHNYGAILLFFTQDSRVLSTLTSYTQILSMLTPPRLFSLLIPKGLM